MNYTWCESQIKFKQQTESSFQSSTGRSPPFMQLERTHMQEPPRKKSTEKFTLKTPPLRTPEPSVPLHKGKFSSPEAAQYTQKTRVNTTTQQDSNIVTPIEVVVEWPNLESVAMQRNVQETKARQQLELLIWAAFEKEEEGREEEKINCSAHIVKLKGPKAVAAMTHRETVQKELVVPLQQNLPKMLQLKRSEDLGQILKLLPKGWEVPNLYPFQEFREHAIKTLRASTHNEITAEQTQKGCNIILQVFGAKPVLKGNKGTLGQQIVDINLLPPSTVAALTSRKSSEEKQLLQDTVALFPIPVSWYFKGMHWKGNFNEVRMGQYDLESVHCCCKQVVQLNGNLPSLRVARRCEMYVIEGRCAAFREHRGYEANSTSDAPTTTSCDHVILSEGMAAIVPAGSCIILQVLPDTYIIKNKQYALACTLLFIHDTTAWRKKKSKTK